MARTRTFSTYVSEATRLMGRQVKLGRKQRKWTESELAERAGISRATLQKIEKGDMACAIGLVFEAAALVGVDLFEADTSPLHRQMERVNDKIALLPKSIHKSKRAIDDDF